MNTLKTIATTIALLISATFTYAQSSIMKDPVSHILKNGMTIIIAENQASPKVYANLSFERSNQYTPEKATVQEVLTTLLNQQLTALDAGFSYSNKGVNLATQKENFETALQTLYAFLNTTIFDQQALDAAKTEVLAHITAQDKYFPETINANSLVKLTLEDLNSYYSEINKPAQTILTIAGNLTPAAAKRFANKAATQKPAADFSKTYLATNN